MIYSVVDLFGTGTAGLSLAALVIFITHCILFLPFHWLPHFFGFCKYSRICQPMGSKAGFPKLSVVFCF
jgi:hypothetical protein